MSHENLITLFDLIKSANLTDMIQLIAFIFLAAFVIFGLTSCLRITVSGYTFKVIVIICLIGAVASSYILATSESKKSIYTKAYILIINERKNMDENTFNEIKKIICSKNEKVCNE